MLEDPGDFHQGDTVRLSRVLAWTQITLAFLALAMIALAAGIAPRSYPLHSLTGSAVRALVVLAASAPLPWLIARQPRRVLAIVLLLVPAAVDLVSSLPSLWETAGHTASALTHHGPDAIFGVGITKGGSYHYRPAVVWISTRPSWGFDLLSNWSGPLTRAAIAIALINALVLSGRLHTGRWLRIPLWTCLALGVGGLPLAALARHVAPGITLQGSEDTLRYAVPTLAAVVTALFLSGHPSRRARWSAFAILLVPAIWYVGTHVYDLPRPPRLSLPPQAEVDQVRLLDRDSMPASWGLATLAWQTVQLAIGLALTSAVLGVLRRTRA
jgi:drug/metabolite transporter (DMT)-like permease